MDISSTSSATATAASSSSQTQRTSKSDSSFKDEMSKVSESKETGEQETEQKVDGIENKTDEKAGEKNDENAQTDIGNNQKLSGEVSMIAGQYGNIHTDMNQNLQMNNIHTDMNQNLQMNNIHTDMNQNLQMNNIQALMDANTQLANVTELRGGVSGIKVDYSNINMTFDDAKFFADLVQNTDKTLQDVMTDLKSNTEQTVQKASQHVKVSSTLMNALNEAVKSNQPVRINLDKDVSVIIKVDKDGALSATFIPGDKAVEEYLRQNISTLRQRFDDQELSYRDLSYSRQKQNQEQNRRNNNKENDNE